MSSDDPYIYPGTTVLRNRFDVRDPVLLDQIERQFVVERSAQGVPHGRFDLAHLQAIHRHLFQDVYEWAGELRTVSISKDGYDFQSPRYIARGMTYVEQQLAAQNYLRDLEADQFASRAGVILGDVNHVHPFREGNGRTQMHYLEQLADQAGHRLDFGRINQDRWLDASRASYSCDYQPMAEEIGRGIGLDDISQVQVSNAEATPAPAASVEQEP
jgi:cell filamentation protein